MNHLKSLLVAGALLGSALVVLGVPPSKRMTPSQTLRTAEELSLLQPGDKVAFVCKQCDAVTVQTIESKEQAMALCKEGETVTCPSCQKEYKVTMHGPRSKPGSHPEVSYVNEKGEECMFIAKLDKGT